MIPAVLLAAVAALLVSGCTARQSHEQYEGRLREALGARTEAITQLDSGQLRGEAAFQDAAGDVDEAADELDADAPPTDIQAAHRAMVRGLRGLADVMRTLGSCESMQLAQARACRRAVGTDVYDEIRNDFDEANTIYRQQGISLPGLGGGGEGGGGSVDDLGDDPAGGDEL